MGKKHKDGKDGKKVKKKKSHDDVSGAGLAAAVVNAARSMRTVLSRNLLATGQEPSPKGEAQRLGDVPQALPPMSVAQAAWSSAAQRQSEGSSRIGELWKAPEGRAGVR